MYNLNPYMCNYVVFNCTMHMYGLYTSAYARGYMPECNPENTKPFVVGCTHML